MQIMTALIYLLIYSFICLIFLIYCHIYWPFYPCQSYQIRFSSYFQLKSSVSASLQENKNANYLRKYQYCASVVMEKVNWYLLL